MGIRIHKVIGYGVPKLKEVKHLIDFKTFRKFEDAEPELEDYLEWCEKNIDLIFEVARGEWHPRVSDESLRREVAFTFEMQRSDAKHNKDIIENGWRSVYSHYSFNNFNSQSRSTAFVIHPAIGYKDWYRYDNIIDYMEANGSKSYVRTFPQGIFPFSGHYVKSEPSPEGVDLPSHASCHLEIPEEYRNLYRPYVPTVILSLLLWPGAFKVQELLKHIRPMVMTYWS